ncbi:hypothetical protein [Streptomyces cavernae]|uniref:hypothetical protein n=1 Tax=Streptomyces cavernae TaxID=2259034 RepID=UPI000FEBE3B4|nr:hypothetical protein [Streptomyces cavernae]
MRQAFAHDAVVVMDADGDVSALGAAVTVALCGHWEHPPPCPLAPHHTAAEPTGGEGEVHIRVLFATEAAAESEVRDRIHDALAGECFRGPDGVTTHWRLLRTGPGAVRDDEEEHAARLSGP